MHLKVYIKRLGENFIEVGQVLRMLYKDCFTMFDITTDKV